MINKLTRRQKQVLDIINESIEERGYPPTIREIGRLLGIRSTNGVSDHLKALERKGFLKRDLSKSRALRPVQLSGRTTPIPILGKIAAGEPILATENIEDTVEVDRFFIDEDKEVFGLRVVGDSMIGDGIYDGDFIFVEKRIQAHTGDIVVALIEDEATVKRYYPEKGRIRFQPSNPDMAPIIVLENEHRAVRILGVVVGVFRRM